MPVVKTTHHAADSAKYRVQKTSKTKGLARYQKALHASEARIPGKSTSPNDTEMIDAENIRSIHLVPQNKELLERVSEASNGSKETTASSTEKTNDLNAPGKEITSTKETPRSLRIVTGAQKQTSGTTGPSQPASSLRKKTNTIPPELRPHAEAAERRATQTASNLELCTTAIYGVEDALSPLANGDNRQYIDAMKTHFRAAIAQFMSTESGVAVTTLPPRPPRPASNVTFWENPPPGSRSSQPIQILEPMIAEPRAAESTTWATVTRRGQQKSSAPASSGRAPSKQPSTPRAPAKTAAPPRQDERLFLRLGKDHDWRQLSPAGVREAVAQHLGLTSDIIEHVYRVPTGFALKAKDEETRQVLIDSAETFTSMGAKLEKASDLTVLRISTVPMALNTRLGRVLITEEMVINEITRITKATPFKARPHGKSRLGAIQQSWLAYFEKASAPRPGFRLLDDSGVTVRHQPQRTVQQCKRCLEFHGTRGCSRAPACWNCSSKMHSTAECKDHTKCRNCGGPHRSDSRSCLARPTRSGPVTKEQLVTIRQASQREFAAVARAKAAVRRAEAAAITAAVQKSASPPALSTSNQFEVLAEDTILPDAEVPGETNPETHS
ncbi:hypothetical protein K3495_g5711 [Podosphaera aphanis]|nr:hypothetical protein K3495_g5711 [Podosphaera aphanis]